MTWYAVHALVALRKEDMSWPVTVYENVFLVEAIDAEQAKKKGVLFAMKEVEVEDGLMISGVPAKREFVGIRKIINVSNPDCVDLDQDRPISGTEITYSEYEVESDDALQEMKQGRPVLLKYVD